MLLIGSVIVAQDLTTPMTVKLKNGDSISGVVTKNEDGSIMVKTIENDTFYFGASEIKSIEIDPDILKARELKEKQEKKMAEELAKEQKKQGRKDKREYRQTSGKGYMTILETGFGISDVYLKGSYKDHNGVTHAYLDDYKAYHLPCLHWINGYSFSPHFFLGAGIGANIEMVSGYVRVPFYIHLRSTFAKSTVAPYIALSGGGTGDILAYDEKSIRPYADATIGIRMGKKKKRGCWLGAGVSYTTPQHSKSIEYSRNNIQGDFIENGASYYLAYNIKFSVSF